MATRARQSAATPAPSTTQPRTSSRLPEYQKPQFAMNTQAQRMIDNLYAKHDFKKLQDAYSAAITTLQESVADINDRSVERRKRHEGAARKRQNRQQDVENEDAEPEEDTSEQRLEDLNKKVESLTKRIDENIRKTIDGQESVGRTKLILAGAAADARHFASTQATLPPRTTQPRRQPDAENDEDDDEQYPEIEPTAPGEPTQTIKGPLDYFKEKTDDAKLLYQNRSLIERYAGNESYRQFRKLLHDAQFPDEEHPQPQPEHWFDEAGRARPGVTQRQGDDEDEDIQISRATTSTKCPITLQEFRAPLTSRLCEHTFEASAINEMIQASHARVNQITSSRGQPQGGQRAVRCPVQSCNMLISEADLYEDHSIVRKIKRLQRAAELEAQEALNNSRLEDGPEVIHDDDEDDQEMDVDAIEAEDEPSRAPIKTERSSRR